MSGAVRKSRCGSNYPCLKEKCEPPCTYYVLNESRIKYYNKPTHVSVVATLSDMVGRCKYKWPCHGETCGPGICKYFYYEIVIDPFDYYKKRGKLRV